MADAPDVGGGGMHMPAFLTKKVGPLPVWGWGGIVAVGLGGILYLRSKSASSTASTTPAVAGGTMAAGSGATGFTEDQLGQLTGLVNGEVASALANAAPGTSPTVGTGTATNPLAAYVNQEYTDLLGRPADTAGATGWVNQLLGGQTSSQQFLAIESTPEAATYAAQNQGVGFITGQYEDVLGRQPDAAGLAYWQGQLAKVGASGESAQFLQAAQPELTAQTKPAA
jgi:hypothetical protein